MAGPFSAKLIRFSGPGILHSSQAMLSNPSHCLHTAHANRVGKPGIFRPSLNNRHLNETTQSERSLYIPDPNGSPST